jgi:hypothetical protein
MVAVIGAFLVSRVSSVATHIMTVNTNAPTAFDPQPEFFCNALHQHGGLQQLIDATGIGSTGTPAAEEANLLMLKFVVDASPDQSTRTAMVDLYREVLSGDSRSKAAQTAIGTVESSNQCARYP